MERCLILLSAYNGGKNIARQINSILKQKNMDAHILVRDDGSNEDTINILKELCAKNSDRMECIFGKNIGWKKSFMLLIYSADLSYDYYGFSDQDDYWMDNKLSTCVKLMKNDSQAGVKLAHCNSLSVDENLEPRKEQEYRIACPPSHKAALTTEYFQGCGMVWNNEAMKMIRKYQPKETFIAHDYWVGLICYLFGSVYFCEEPQFYHIRYKNNSSSDGNIVRGRMQRLKLLLSGNQVYMNPAQDLLVGYSDILNLDDKKFLMDLINYKKDMRTKLKLFLDKDFSRNSVFATVLFKFVLLVNKY